MNFAGIVGLSRPACWLSVCRRSGSTLASLQYKHVQDVPPPQAWVTARLYLIRHGKTAWNLEKRIQGSVDESLNDVGQKQALVLGRALADFGFVLVASAALSRAATTADMIVQYSKGAQKAKRVCLDELNEMHFGNLEGRVVTEPDVKHVYDETHAAWAAGAFALKWPGDGGESLDDVHERVKRALTDGKNSVLLQAQKVAEERELGPSSEPMHIAVVAHTKVIKVYLASILYDGDLSRHMELDQATTAINVVDLGADRAKVVAVSVAGHAERDAGGW